MRGGADVLRRHLFPRRGVRADRLRHRPAVHADAMIGDLALTLTAAAYLGLAALILIAAVS